MRLTRTRVERLRSNHQRRAHRVERQFLKIITRLPGQNLVDHERLVASPDSLQLPGRGEPQLGLAVHGVCVRAAPRVSAAPKRKEVSLFFLRMSRPKRVCEGEGWSSCV